MRFSKSLLIFLLTIAIILPSAQNSITKEQPGNLGKWVNSFIGSGGYPWMCGFTFPGATTPFGMVRLSPDTALFQTVISNLHTSGYYYNDNEIMGFSHTRLSGTGASDGGHFLVVPTVGPVSQSTRSKGQYARFSHKDELAFPGYYAVKLKNLNILCELTATTRVGVHRYTFPQGKVPHILLDVTNALGDGKSDQGAIKIIPKTNEIEGCARIFGTFSSRYGGIKAYFVARFNKPFANFGIWKDDSFFPKQTSLTGDELGADIEFGDSKVELKLAISYVSIENARANLQKETENTHFDEVLANAKKVWEQNLALIDIQGGTKKQKTCFYTSLYHSLIMPTIFNDVNGDYLGFDKRTYKTSDFNYYTDLSLWDTFRTVHPLFTLIAKKEQRDIVKSLEQMYKQGGYLPRWPSGAGYTNSMFGTPADIVIADSYLKGIKDFNVNSIYQSMRKTALSAMPKHAPFSGREGNTLYNKYQYCPEEFMKEAVARTMEFSYADYTVGLLAKELGFAEDAKLFFKRAKNYRNLFNPQTQYFQSKNASGEFKTPFYPLLLTYLDIGGKYTNDYVEGSALHWRWAAFFDPKGLISLFKSKEYFVKELNTFFARSNASVGAPIPSSYYWHGNEHDMHAVYLFNEAGRPDLTQKWVHWIMDKKYNTKPHGLDGNDDAGTISAWYVFSALGFYPVAGSSKYQIGSPLFKEAKVKLGNKNLYIVAENYAPGNIYIQQIQLNGKLIDRTWLEHSEIAQGGTLRFVMSAQPKK